MTNPNKWLIPGVIEQRRKLAEMIFQEKAKRSPFTHHERTLAKLTTQQLKMELGL